MGDEARKRRAAEWKRFAEQEGGLFEILGGLEGEAVEAFIADPEPGPGHHAYLRALRDLRTKVQSIINSGRVDEAEQAAKARIQAGETKAFH